ncbi:MAG: RNA polymerase sigma factor [Spirochaetes bacterium]|nr:RNA polymerase sigma factor [Spirochaetota bacterium]
MLILIFIIFNDEDLIKIQNRDPDIFEKIYKKYKAKLYNYFFIKTNGNIMLAEELFSDTFHSALISAPKLKSMKNVQSWLISIANRRFIDHLRSRYKNKQQYGNTLTEEKIDHYDINCSEIQNNDKVIMTKLALNNLRDKYRDILTLKYIENKSQIEIAELTNKSVLSVQSILFRARESLKKELLKITRDN